MNKIKITSFLYQKTVKPVLFKINPDDVHSGMLAVGQYLQASYLMRRGFKKVYGNRFKELTYRVNELSMDSPFGISAGFDKNAKLVPLVSNLGFGFIICGSMTRFPHEGNAKPWFKRLPADNALIVNAGLPNEGYDQIKSRIMEYKHTTGNIPVSLSLATFMKSPETTIQEVIDDIVYMICDIQKFGLSKMIEINISCPNILNREIFTEKGNLIRLFEAIQGIENINIPIFVKMPAKESLSEFLDIVKIIDGFSVVKGLTISNLRKSRENYNFKSDSDLVMSKGGISGRPVQQISDEYIKAVYSIFGARFTIIGVGGVFSAEDVYRKMKLGASLVAGVTGLIYQGPQLAASINQDLVDILKRDGYSNISEVIGVDVKK